MDELSATLQRNGIDPATLQIFAEVDGATLYRLQVPGAQAQRLWLQLRQLTGETGLWPVIVGQERDLERHLSNISSRYDPRSVLNQGLGIDAAEWLNIELQTLEGGAGDQPAWQIPHGRWPEEITPDDRLTVPYDPSGGAPYLTVYVVLVPAAEGWQAPAWLNFGGWDDCPRPAQHIALLKRWGEIYRAEVACISSDTIEMVVANPPQSGEGAVALALEQYLYAPEVVGQGFDTVEALAASLLDGHTWWFWWD